MDTTSQEFDEYLRQSEPHRRERAESWRTAIGLQAVDGLKTSAYLVETAKRHIEGDINIEDVKGLLKSYYQNKTNRTPEDSRTEEADKVSANIARVLNEKTFTFSPMGYISIHRRVFEGVFKFAGQIRDYNITKKEWVLNGDTVFYASAAELRQTLDYDFDQEAKFEYKGLTAPQVVSHIAKFISGVWQIHPFGEGNTRTSAVFCIKYLRSMGFDVANDLFAEHAWYFRNALVRANYRNYQKGVEPNAEFLEAFFRNLLLGEDNELKNRCLLVTAPQAWMKDAVQAPNKHRISTVQVGNAFTTNQTEIRRLVQALGKKELSVREILILLNLKHRANFLITYLTPAIQAGCVTMLYPEKPKHPRQKYRLTTKGLEIYQQLKENRE